MSQKNSKWLKTAKAPDLKKNEVHIWRTYLNLSDHPIDNYNSILSEDEKAKARRFRFDNDKKRFIITRGFLRQTLGQYLEIPAKELIFTYNKYGKPSVINPGTDQMEFNLSHSANVILFAFTKERKLGIDVERLRPIRKARKIVDRFFSDKEKQFYNSQDITEREKIFFKLWTYKEAYTKAKGLGLALPLNQFEVPLEKDSYSKDWSWYEIKPDSEYFAAMAVENSNFEIKQWHYGAY